MFRSALVQTALRTTRPIVPRTNLRPFLIRAYHEKVISHYEKPKNVRINSIWFLDKAWTSLSDNVYSRWAPSQRMTLMSELVLLVRQRK